MSKVPDKPVTLEWLGRTLLAIRDDVRSLHRDMGALRRDLDMATRIILRLDHTVDALREEAAKEPSAPSEEAPPTDEDVRRAKESYERLIAMVEEARRVPLKREVEAELGATPAVRILTAAKAPPNEQAPQADKTEQDQETPRAEHGGTE